MGENEPWLPTPVSSPHTSWLKKCLWNYLKPQADVERSVHADADHKTRCSFCSGRLLIVAFLAMLALIAMGLLLFWNYHCIFVWHLCDEDKHVFSVPALGEG